MPLNKKQLLRLLRLVAQLKENRYPNSNTFIKELYKLDLDENINLLCSKKTIQRDIKVLREDFNAPIKFDKVRNGYYLQHQGWAFTYPFICEDEELLAAILGARIAESIFPSEMQSKIRKAVDLLLSYNTPDFLDKMNIDSLIILDCKKAQIKNNVFMNFFNAWQQHKVCNISYKTSDNTINDLIFEPHTLIFSDCNWYSKGFSKGENRVKIIILENIEKITLTNTTFEPDSKIIKSVDIVELACD